MTYTIGIDPGKSGSLCALPKDRNQPPIFFDTPSDGYADYDLPLMRQNLFAVLSDRSVTGVWLELPGVIPSIKGRRVGTSQMFEMGRGVGLWQGLLTGVLCYSFLLVRPQVWKRRLLAGVGKEDADVHAFACRSIPLAAPNLQGPRGGLKMDRVDALLIALYGEGVAGG